MKVIIISQEELPAELQQLTAQICSPDSREGQKYAQLYSAMSWPTVIITRDDGALVEIWQATWPTIAQIEYHMNASF